MRFALLLFGLLYSSLVYSQSDSLPDELLDRDTLIINTKNSFCNGFRNNTIKIFKANDSLIDISYSSLHFPCYFFLKTKFYKSNKREAKRFLRQNNIELYRTYNEFEKPSDSLIGESNGLSRWMISEYLIDSTETIESSEYFKIKNFYNQARAENLQDYSLTNGLIVAGSGTSIEISLSRNDSVYTLMPSVSIIGTYGFRLLPEE